MKNDNIRALPVLDRIQSDETPVRSNARLIALATSFALVIFGLFIANIIYKAPEISSSERRRLATFTPPTFATVIDGSFMSEFDSGYSLDSFFMRDAFRSLKANVQFNLLRQLDNNSIYVTNGHAAKLETLNESSVSSAGDKIARLIEALPDGINLYYSIIPDKSYYLATSNGYPSMDYGKIRSLLADRVKAEYIDLFSVLSADNYYRTDLHWEQSTLAPVLGALGDAMGFETSGDFEKTPLSPFYGVYYGQSALSLPSETLYCLKDSATDSASVKLLDTKTLEMTDSVMYDETLFSSIDPYNTFLSGPQAIVTIENPDLENGRELFIFRDSFSSSLAPLLTQSYSKITLIDLRYIASPLVFQMIEFPEGSDVLFLYGTLVLNSSATLLVQ